MPQKETLYPSLDLEDNGTSFRLNTISEIRNFLDSEVDSRGRLRRKYKSAYNALFYLSTMTGTVAILSGTSGLITLSTGVGVIVAIPLGVASMIMSLTSVGSSAICKLLLKKIEKHQNIKNIAMAKMSSINDLVSKALEDNKISDDEFKIIMQERENYRAHKNQIRQRVQSKVKDMNEKMKKELLEQGEKKGVEKIQKLLSTHQP